MWTFGWSWTRLCCYADHGVGWGGVGMLTFVCSWTRHACYADHGVGWRCERSVEVEHASAATLIMGWGGVGVGMLTFVCSWTRHAFYADHGVGWRCERSVEVEHASAATLIMGWGGVGMLTFVSMPRSINTFDPGNGVGKTLCVLTSWKKPQRSTCTMINESGKAKKVRNLCCKGCKIQEKWPFLGTCFSWTEGHETLKGLSFLSAGWCAYTRDSAPGGMFILWVKRFRCRPLNMLSFRVKSLHHALWRSGLVLGVMRLFKSINDMMDNNMDGCVISCFDVIYIYKQ